MADRCTHFNPRSHVGSDTRHKPPRAEGAYFNPRSHVGSDAILSARANDASISIHAPTWGATFSARCEMTVSIVFQSTLPRGERPLDWYCFGQGLLISIHAPTWGATPHGRHYSARLPYFNPRSHVGSDQRLRFQIVAYNQISIHAPTWGATVTSNPVYLALSDFNPRSHVGSDGIDINRC